MNPSFADILSSVAAGGVRLVMGEAVGEALEALARLSREELQGARLLVVVWDDLPPYEQLLEDALDQLALAALAFWPDWYESSPAPPGAAPTSELVHERAVAAGLVREVLPAWLQRAAADCRRGAPPRWKHDFTATAEARQLALALGDRTCRLVLVLRCAPSQPGRLLGLARTAEWLARETRLPVLVLTGGDAGRSPELDSISYQAVALTVDQEPPAPSAALGEGPLRRPSGPTVDAPARGPSRGPRLLVRPLIGRPHPDSPGEQLLWKTLQSDAELAGLFQCNQWAETVCDTTHLVDFVSRAGTLVVEVDGYRWHSSRHAFAHDRRRDYELTVSGYAVMRLPHDEIVSDVAEAVERIRRLVRTRISGGSA